MRTCEHACVRPPFRPSVHEVLSMARVDPASMQTSSARGRTLPLECFATQSSMCRRSISSFICVCTFKGTVDQGAIAAAVDVELLTLPHKRDHLIFEGSDGQHNHRHDHSTCPPWSRDLEVLLQPVRSLSTTSLFDDNVSMISQYIGLRRHFGSSANNIVSSPSGTSAPSMLSTLRSRSGVNRGRLLALRRAGSFDGARKIA